MRYKDIVFIEKVLSDEGTPEAKKARDELLSFKLTFRSVGVIYESLKSKRANIEKRISDAERKIKRNDRLFAPYEYTPTEIDQIIDGIREMKGEHFKILTIIESIENMDFNVLEGEK